MSIISSATIIMLTERDAKMCNSNAKYTQLFIDWLREMGARQYMIDILERTQTDVPQIKLPQGKIYGQSANQIIMDDVPPEK